MPPTSKLLPVVVDCDPGHDDFFAILHAARATNLLGITTVAGNSPLHNTTKNALIAAQLFDMNVPVHSGADRPLIAPVLAAKAVLHADLAAFSCRS
jgi:inosine-uridine nucleoside N-ribohydrolase